MSTCLSRGVGCFLCPPSYTSPLSPTHLHTPSLLSHLPSLSTPILSLSSSPPPPPPHHPLPPPPLSSLFSPCQLDRLWQDAPRADQGTQLENWVSGAVWNRNAPSPALPRPSPLPLCCSPSSQTTGSSHFPKREQTTPSPWSAIPSPSSGCQWNSQLRGNSAGLTVQRPHPGQSPSLGLSLPICKMRFHLRALPAQAMWLLGLSIFPPKQQAPYLLSWLASFCAFVFIMNGLGFPGGSDGKESACMRETWVRFLGWEDPLEKGTATHSSILAWTISMDRGAWRDTVHRVTKSQPHGRLSRLSN